MNKTYRNLFITDFQVYMESLDSRLNEKYFPICNRDFYALNEIANETGLMLTPVYQKQISNWFKNRYDKKMNPPCNMQMVILVRNIPYLVKFPILFGKVEINPFNFICDLTENLLKSLSFPEKKEVANIIIKNVERFNDNKFSSLLTYSNLAEAVSNILAFRVDSQTDGYSVSKWASLQLAEKAIKTYTKQNNLDFDYTHDLKNLIKKSILTFLQN